jgi:hypothetical protein
MRSLDTEGTGVVGHRATATACGGGAIPTDILSIGRATPALRVTQERSFQYSGYRGKTIRRLFLNTGIAFRHFYFENALRVDETSDELNRRYLHGAMETGCKAARACLAAGGLSPRAGPKSGQELADVTGADRQALCRLLRALCAMGVFRAPAADWAKFITKPGGTCSTA